MTNGIWIGAALAAGCCAAPAFGQFLEYVPSESVVDISTGPQTIEVSVFADRDGVTDGYFADFQGWYSIRTDFVLEGSGSWVIPVENENDDSDGQWYGRRPSSEPTFSKIGFGSFRNPTGLPINYEVLNGSGDRWVLRKAGQYSWTRTEAYQNGTLIGGTLPDKSDRIEIYRFQVLASGTGFIDLSFDLSGSEILIDERGVSRYIAEMEYRTRRITVVPAPGVLALLAPAACLRRRRR